jgi:hypothetical protein
MDVVVVLAVVALFVAVVAAYIILSRRVARDGVPRAAPAPRPGLKLKPLADLPPPTPRAPAEPVVMQAPVPAPAPSAAPPLLFDLDLDLEPIAPVAVPPLAAAPAPPSEIRWWKQFDARPGELDDVARLRLIGDLGIVAKEWCVPLLAQAYEEERRPGHRQAALTALAACRSRAAAATFRTALTGGDPTERAIAADALADLEPVPPAKLRRAVERH